MTCNGRSVRWLCSAKEGMLIMDMRQPETRRLMPSAAAVQGSCCKACACGMFSKHIFE